MLTTAKSKKANVSSVSPSSEWAAFRKTLEQKVIFQIGTLNPHGINEHFHSTNLFLFSRHHTPTNSVAPLYAYKPTHNPQFL